MIDKKFASKALATHLEKQIFVVLPAMSMETNR